jgi:hypothetical protein
VDAVVVERLLAQFDADVLANERNLAREEVARCKCFVARRAVLGRPHRGMSGCGSWPHRGAAKNTVVW